ncbi:hypothetical protein [Mycolicibacterium mageritense]|uniref:hypothetical protein n=1 Tax=Mycolicibacterium mageritense TaxID=53462 RepID=UPI00103C1CBC|nr:hypothetical protein [Mycolicibacterium mageritense]MCC9181323.1 hypothetical protein [Mycolicibacterium mageritense]TXI65232.1 MAG: hypothetical protein E6Q55_02935 [Mycolicibacterium mageritense]
MKHDSLDSENTAEAYRFMPVRHEWTPEIVRMGMARSPAGDTGFLSGGSSALDADEAECYGFAESFRQFLSWRFSKAVRQ